MNNFKIILTTIVLILFSISTIGQQKSNVIIDNSIPDEIPVSWSVNFEKSGEKQITILFKATLPKEWHIYAADPSEDLTGPEIIFEDSSIQNGKIVFKEKSHLIVDAVFENRLKNVYENEITFSQLISFGDSFPSALKLILKYEAASGINFYTSEKKIKIILNQKEPIAVFSILKPTINIDHPVNSCGIKSTTTTKSKSLFSLFFIGFLGGLIALLTPCVFPMIPLTVFFYQKSKIKKRRGFKCISLWFFYFFNLCFIEFTLSLFG